MRSGPEQVSTSICACELCITAESNAGHPPRFGNVGKMNTGACLTARDLRQGSAEGLDHAGRQSGNVLCDASHDSSVMSSALQGAAATRCLSYLTAYVLLRIIGA